MRSGGSAANQALNSEAASLVKQAVALAKRRGHAQVTPLHVANAMLGVPCGLLRAACMQSHSHPLQCKALELCFNVALNRLPASSSLTLAHQYPASISNALVAAFKRAQAHQRRGSAEAPVLAVKIELQQLVISILDDPSVSRVMREAGFSSTQVKANVEKVVSLDLSKNSRQSGPDQGVLLDSSPSINGDVQTLVTTMLTSRKKRSFVVVGEAISEIESTVKELMNRVDNGGVPEGLKQVKFITIPPFYSFCNLDKELVQQKMGELAYLVKNLVGKGVVLYLGDLNWVSEYRANFLDRERSYYCPVEHMVMEIGKLIYEIGETAGRFWIMGIATFQTYIRCKNGYNDSLESIWRLNPVTIPANSLGLSLISQSSNGAKEANGSLQQFVTHGEVTTLTCCPECCSKFEAEAENFRSEPTLSSNSLPPWLKDESRRLCNNNQNINESSSIMEVGKKWNAYCSSSSSSSCAHQRTLTFDPPHLSLSTRSCDPDKEFNAVNLNRLCNALEEEVPWQREIIPEIAGTILQCRSGMMRRRNDTWLLFMGPDSLAKQKMATCLARHVFGSSSSSSSSSSDVVHIDCLDRLGEAVSANPHRVFLVQGFEGADYLSQVKIKRAIESGRLIVNGEEEEEEVSLCDAIVVLSCERFSCSCRSRSPPVLLDLNTSFHDESLFIDDLGIFDDVDRILVFKIPNI